MRERPLISRLLWIGLFSLAMAFLEAAVVVYLRELYYPEGFSFPLKLIPTKIALIELGREAATIVMLGTLGYLSGRSSMERFACFLYAFALWDLFYYLWLKISLNWPPSLITWDVLFLIPVPWSAPVLAPVLVSSSLLVAAVIILGFESRGRSLKTTFRDWGMVVAAAAVLFTSFIWEYPDILQGGIPSNYRWELFLIGQLLWIGTFLVVLRENLLKK